MEGTRGGHRGKNGRDKGGKGRGCSVDREELGGREARGVERRGGSNGNVEWQNDCWSMQQIKNLRNKNEMQ